MEDNYFVVKERFYALVGNLSIEEIMSNAKLADQIKSLSKLLVELTS